MVNTLTKDENVPEANSNEDNEMPKLTVLDDHEEMTERNGNDDSKVLRSWQKSDSNAML